MMRKISALLLALILVFGLLPATAVSAASDSITAYVTASIAGVIPTGTGGTFMAQAPVTVTDHNNSGGFDIDDTLFALHEAYYAGGAASGYSSADSGHGLGITKLWGDDSGAYGYWVNGVSAMSLGDVVKAGDHITVFIYADTTGYSDSFVKFDTFTKKAVAGEQISLKLQNAGYDNDWNTVWSDLAGASVYDIADPDDVLATTDASGAATVSFPAVGTYYITASHAPTTIVPPVCAITVLPSGTDLWKNPFSDVKGGDGFYEAVSYVEQDKLFSGTATTTFSPNTNMTRAMLATVLYRLAGSPAVTGSNGFTDVKSGQWYTDAAVWASTNKIAYGYGNGLFGTNDNVTREQMAAILMNYARYKGYDVTKAAALTSYTDAASVDTWATDAMKWAVGEGLVTATTATALEPDGAVTRAQAATILELFVKNITG